MRVREMMLLAAGSLLVAGGSAVADDVVALPDGTTVTRGAQTELAQFGYPSGCSNIYETFNDTFEPNYGTGWTVSDGFVGCWGPAHKFTPAEDKDLCQILVSATHVTGTNQYLVRLHADDAGGNEPGTELGSWEFFNIPQNTAGPTPLLEADATGISLTGGDGYWLSFVASGGNSDSWGVLRQSTLPGNERQSSTWKCSFWEARGTINAGAWQVTGQDGGGRYSLRIDGECPGTVRVSWDGAGAGSQGLVIGNNLGSTTIPGSQPCAGTVLGIAGSVMLVDPPGIFGTNGGQGTISGRCGGGAAGKYLQLVKGGTCETSNVVQIP